MTQPPEIGRLLSRHGRKIHVARFASYPDVPYSHRVERVENRAKDVVDTLNVGLNEWGHAFWVVDEMFAATLHWGFVALGWCGLLGGFWRRGAQTATRMSNLAHVIWNGAPKSIFDPFSSHIASSTAHSGY